MTLLALAQTALALWVAMTIVMTLAWAVDRRTGNAGWVDVIWTTGLGVTGIIAATTLWQVSDGTPRQFLIAALVLIWTLRLAGYILVRSQHVSDDPRYAKFKSEWGESAALRMFGFLQIQALASVPLLLGIVIAAWNPTPLLTATDMVGLVVFGTGLLGGFVADRQMAQFKADKRARARTDTADGPEVCRRGLWAWSRHPNYFFEWVVWLSYAIFALAPFQDHIGSGTATWPWGWLGLIAPAFIYWLLRYVSGVPLLEQHMREKYGDAYRAYQDTTSPFFPWPPRETPRS